MPVNYLLDGDVVVFRSGPGTKLRALRGTPASFQLDDIDPTQRTGWSVLVRGRADEATHWEIDHLDLTAWAPGDKSHWVRVVPDAITGRRIRRLDGFVDGWLPITDWGCLVDGQARLPLAQRHRPVTRCFRACTARA